MTPFDEALRGVDRLFEQRSTETRAPSASYGVFTPGGLVHTGSTGAVAGSSPTADTIYRIASCTKSFTATVVLALRDAGQLGLDNPITRYIPAFEAVRLPTADSPVPTIRMLLTMSAGFPTDDPWGDRQESITDDELDALLGTGLRFDSVPGTTFAYSNLGYALLGRIISVVAGRPYRDVVTDTILRPLGLTSTGFVRPDDDSRLAIGHRRLDDDWQPLPFSGPGGFSSIGGLFSTVTDLARWARWLASAFDGAARDAGADDAARSVSSADHDDILSRSSRREMQQFQRFVPSVSASTGSPAGYGFGLFVEEVPGLGPVVSHSGGYPGFSAHMRWHAGSGIGIVAFENATYAQVSVPAAATLHALLSEVGAVPAAEVWPETRVAQAAVDAAVRGGSLFDPALVSPNVELDIPFTHRRRVWAEAIAAVGELEPASLPDRLTVDADAGESSQAPSHLRWRIVGDRGALRVEIRLTPEGTPRIQTLTVRPEHA
ncbi:MULTISPECIES: serine hydrolase [unclassified Frondihabitans]|uniref:serine hydrolase domain-containing protein n=1 Tax=unclassified Frondihabitans TaxID=2626248 RepID=UPI000F4EDE57|nr:MULTISPECIES: serine hydrolase domain-containing protein [unclassified Frondihabitans]RPE78848.1 CubicO group peptidase (beta-lactamase class C family) [Frondihabitans sp. PhB153]RPF09129.1 CubicO group peptidase (beta-lactamase class C family) [Frondihabitans sp. PhB161]